MSHKDSGMLKFITCGSVDDGKSTLIGRLLYEAQAIYDDQISALTRDSDQHGTCGDKLDLALLVDGLQSEREQGITIDVAYRYFSTPRRKFIIADTPGHEQYTRNMATGASTAELAIILIDATGGVKDQTKRHTFICHLLGIRNFVVAINKMDLVGFDEGVFKKIEKDFLNVADNFKDSKFTMIPLSALEGDNVVVLSAKMPWYKGPTLLPYLESVEVDGSSQKPEFEAPLRLPVQYVNRPSSFYRGYCGTIASGELRTGQTIKVLPSGQTAKVKELHIADLSLEFANLGQSISVVLDREIDVSRGDLIVDQGDSLSMSRSLEANVVWMDKDPLEVGRSFKIKHRFTTVEARVTKIEYKVDIHNFQKSQSDRLKMNEIGLCHLDLDKDIATDTYEACAATGSFIFIDPLTNSTCAAGMVTKVKAQQNVVWHQMDVTKELRASRNHQKPVLIWFTGLSGSGKSTLANALEKQLFGTGRRTYLLDGDNIRHGLCKDLGFDDRDRSENIRRIGEVSKLMIDAGLIVIACFISPFTREREMVRRMLKPGEFFEVFVDTPLEVCEKRDPKGLYKKARKGEIKNFTGIDSPYEKPLNPDIVIDSADTRTEDSVYKILSELKKRKIV